MNFILRSWATFLIAVRRLIAQRGLALAIALGLVASVAMMMSIPLYSDAVYYRILQEELRVLSGNSRVARPSFAFMFRYSGSLHGLKQWDEVTAADAYLSGPAIAQLGLPRRNTVRYAKTDNFRLFPSAAVASGAYKSAKDPLEWVSYSFMSDFEQHVNLIEGNLPAPASSNPDDPVEVVVSKALAEQLGIQAGEDYVTFREVKLESGNKLTIQIPVRVTGIWQAKDPADEYWFYRLDVFIKQLVVPEATFQGRIASLLPDEVGQILWYWLMDGSEVHAPDADRLAFNIEQIQQRAATLLSDTRLEISPYDALRKYRSASRILNILLYAFSIPIVSLLLAFIGLVVGLSVNRQRNEIAVLRSRGATISQIIGIAVLEATILGALALAVGSPLSTFVAQAIGATKSFLNFTLESGLRVQLTASTLRFGLAAVGVTLLAQVLPSIGASKHTIISYKQEQARQVRPPWWQRAWLDVLLLIPAGYGAYLLRQQGTIVAPGGLSGGIFDNPLLFLTPALGALSLTLVILRLLPILMTIMGWIAGRTHSVGFLLATRYLSRDPGFYTTPLILLILTLSLSAFTASLAQTLDTHLFDQSYYQVGADANLVELGASNDAGSGIGGAPAAEAAAPAATGDEAAAAGEPQWVFIPVSEHLKVKEIEAATRVGEFSGSVQVQGQWVDSAMLGVDRVDFPKAAYWRRDFAPASLGALMNALAVGYDGLLMERKFMRQNTIRVGDSIQVRINGGEVRPEVTMKVVGEIDYFPRWYSEAEENKPLLVGNLDYIFEQVGGEQPYNVWVKVAPNADYNQMMDELRKHEITVFDYDVALHRIAKEQRRPERQGLFGILSVGFLASGLLTVLGFLLYALFSFRRRFIELGTLRAVGLSSGQLTIFLACELAFLILLGLGAGTWLGAFISDIFIPSLQIGNDVKAKIPPFTVQIAWPAITRIYLLFGGLFVVALGGLVALLLRMKIFQAIKLGETV